MKGKPSRSKGCKWTEAQKAAQSERMKGSKNPFFGKHHTQDTKERLSCQKTGKPNPKLIGHPVSEETRAKISEKQKGKPACNRRKVDQLTLDGEYIRTFDSIAQASIELSGTPNSHIRDVCNGKRSQAYGYK